MILQPKTNQFCLEPRARFACSSWNRTVGVRTSIPRTTARKNEGAGGSFLATPPSLQRSAAHGGFRVPG